MLANAPAHAYRGQCTYCGHCAPCPKGIDIAMVNKLRFSEYDILGQTLLRLESAELKQKRKNTAAREISRSIADLNAKLRPVDQHL